MEIIRAQTEHADLIAPLFDLYRQFYKAPSDLEASRQFIAERLKALPDMQRKVLALYYFEDMRLREIAEAFGLTESRICQIHAQAILAIKSHLTKFDPLFA